jgi:Cu/Ag efflux protein CusF
MTSLPNLSQLDELIQLMMSAAIYSADELKDLRKKDKQRESAVIARMFEKGESYGVASGGPAFLNQPEDAFFAYMKSIDNDLDVHVGKVISVDAEKHTIKMKHDPIKSLGWPTMTMSFTADSGVDLSSVKEGDSVSFALKPVGKDDYTLTNLKKK